MSLCLNCGMAPKQKVYTYCSNQCQMDHRYYTYITDWKNAKENGSKGVNTKGVSNHLRKYMIDKYEEKCVLCGWKKINTITGRVPLEIDHIDGNSDNNVESNLRLLCPNYHSLTTNFRNLNKGSGRSWRRIKYLKNK